MPLASSMFLIMKCFICRSQGYWGRSTLYNRKSNATPSLCYCHGTHLDRVEYSVSRLLGLCDVMGADDGCFEEAADV